MSAANNLNAVQEEQGNSLYAALARTTTRSIALYFSRPVRLFRPSKVSGWHSLKGLASQSGAVPDTQYLSGLVKKQGFMVIPKHFIPPMVVNAILGTVLWTSFSQTFDALEPHLGSWPTLTAALSGAAAGGIQALVAAPVENVRLVIEGGTGNGWSHAWKEVFRGTIASPSASRQQNMQEIRQVREWMKEVGSMAGRGWDGWGWGCAKDICGFATFFAIFEITRGIASRSGVVSQTISRIFAEEDRNFQRQFQRIVHSVILVTGGVTAGLSYELVSHPWDVSKKTVQDDRLTNTAKTRSTLLVVMNKLQADGVWAFFRDPTVTAHTTSTFRNKFGLLKTLGRVGPWGLGFLVWEALGPGLP